MYCAIAHPTSRRKTYEGVQELIFDLCLPSLYHGSVRCYLVREVSAIATVQFETVVDRLARDKAFRMKYCQDPDRTLESYLSPEEIRAIKTGDGHRLHVLGCGDKLEELHAALCGPQPVD